MVKKSRNLAALEPIQKIKVSAREASLAYENAKKFSQQQPDDLIHDPRYAVKVSRGGLDKGAIARDVFTDTAPDPSNPLKSVQVTRLRSGLGRLLADGVITQDMFEVGQMFNRHFEIVGYGHYSSMMLDDVGGGGGIESRFEHTIRSRIIVHEMLDVVHYPYTQMSKAVWWIVGHGLGLEEMSKRNDLHDCSAARDRRYWIAMVIAALELMTKSYQQKNKKNKKNESRSFQSFRG